MVSVQAAVGCQQGCWCHGRREQQSPGRQDRGVTWGLGFSFVHVLLDTLLRICTPM